MCILNTVVLCHCDVYTLIITEYTTAGRVYTLNPTCLVCIHALRRNPPHPPRAKTPVVERRTALAGVENADRVARRQPALV